MIEIVDVLFRSSIDKSIIFVAWFFWLNDRYWHESDSKYEKVAINNVEKRFQRLSFFSVWIFSKFEVWRNWIRKNKTKTIRFENEWFRKKRIIRIDVWWFWIEKKFVNCNIFIESSYDLTKSNFDETSILEIAWRRKNIAIILNLLVN